VIKVIESKLQESNNQESRINELNKKNEKCNRTLKNLIHFVGDGINIKEERDEMNKIQKERDFLESEILSLKNESFGDEYISTLVQKVQSLTSDFERIFKKSPVHIEKKLIRLFVEKIEVDPDNNRFDFTLKMCLG
jgi:cell division protein FtsB